MLASYVTVTHQYWQQFAYIYYSSSSLSLFSYGVCSATSCAHAVCMCMCVHVCLYVYGWLAKTSPSNLHRHYLHGPEACIYGSLVKICIILYI